MSLADERSPQSWYWHGVERTQRALRGVSTADAPAAAARIADELTAESPTAPDRDCSAGCAHCCHFPVGATASEVIAITHALRQTLSDGPYASTIERVRRAAAFDWRARAKKRTACPLLGEDHRCTVYPARPVACRGWNSTSVDACASEGQTVEFGHHVDSPAFFACSGVHDALARHGDDVESYDLVRALAITLAAKDLGTISLNGCSQAGFPD